MAKVVKRTFSLTEAQAAYIDEKVETGEFASGSEVMRAGLRAMREHDARIEQWLRMEVVPVAERVEAGLEPLLSADEVRESLREEYQRMVKAAE